MNPAATRNGTTLKFNNHTTKEQTMWIFSNQGFVSVVQKPDDKDTLTVRARVKGDIARVFPGAKEKAGGGTDYAYRAKVPREQVAKAIHDQIMALDYDNFKNSIPNDDHHSLCNGVWHVGYRHQAAMAHRATVKGKQKSIGF